MKLPLMSPLRAPKVAMMAPLRVAQEEFWYQDTRILALKSPLLALMAVAKGLVPALVALWAPMRVAQKEFWYLVRAKLALISPLLAPMAVAQGLVPALLALLAPMRVTQEEFWYLDRVKMALISPLQSPLAVAQGLVFYLYLTVGLESLVPSLRPPFLIRPFPISPSPIPLVPGPSLRPPTRVLLASFALGRVTQEESWCLVLMELALVSHMSRGGMPVPLLDDLEWCLGHPRYTLFFPPNLRILRPSYRPSLGSLWLTSPFFYC